MNTNTADRRVKKTRKALRDGLAALMLDKELSNISVQELAEKADVHRATFYSHYKDIYDLYEQMEDTVVHDLETIIIGDLSHTYDEVLTNLVDYVFHNAATCSMFLNKKGNRGFYDRISEVLEEKYAEIWQYEMGEREITEEWTFLARYHLQGCLSLLSLWAENSYQYPKDKLTEILLKVDTNFDPLLYE